MFSHIYISPPFQGGVYKRTSIPFKGRVRVGMGCGIVFIPLCDGKASVTFHFADLKVIEWERRTFVISLCILSNTYSFSPGRDESIEGSYGATRSGNWDICHLPYPGLNRHIPDKFDTIPLP